MDVGQSKNLSLSKDPGKDEVLDLALTMQAMTLVEPGICRIQSNHLPQQEEPDFSFCLIMKVASTGGSQRSISHQALEKAMGRAWRSNSRLSLRYQILSLWLILGINMI
jgi:hypothetical protein